MEPIDISTIALDPGVKPYTSDEQNAFILSCFRTLAPAPAGEVRRPDAVRDWRSAVESLGRHGLLSVLEAVADGVPLLTSVPPEVKQIVLRNRLRLALYHANALSAMEAVDREMKEAGIPYAVLKGTYIYEMLYRDVFPREYEDIDLLVPADRIQDAIGALRKAGYDGAGESISIARWHFHVTLASNRPGGLPIELHRSLVDKANLYRVHEEGLFERLKEFKTRQGSFSVLSAEDQLIYLCLHTAKHGIMNFVGLRGGYSPEWFCGSAIGNRLLWFLDIELFLKKHRDSLDWRVVSERMHKWNVKEDVISCLLVLKLLMPGSQAEQAMEKLGIDSVLAAGNGSARRKGMLERILQSRKGAALLERLMMTSPRFLFRPIRIVLIVRNILPSPGRLLSYYGKRSLMWLPWLYITHPFHMIRKILAQ